MRVVRPPGPPARGVIGNFPMGSADPLGLFQRWAAEYGDVVYYRSVNRHIYFLTHPDPIKDVLLTHHRNFIKGEALRNNSRLFGKGLLLNEGASWLQQRRLIQPAFHRDKVAACAGMMTRLTEEQLLGWRDGAEIDLYREMMQLALRIVCRALFGMEIAGEQDRFSAAIDTVLELSAGGRVLLPPVLRRVPTPGNLRYERAARVLDEVVYGMIRQRRREPDGRGDLLSELLVATGAEGAPLTERQVRDEVMTLLLAGHETTAVSLTWTWALLAENPEVEARLAEEVRGVLGGRVPVLEDLARLPYLGRVVKEGLRLYPPIWAMVREPLEDCELGGYRVPAGSTVLISQYVTQRDPRFWAEPERFDPDRWLGEPEHKFAYFPFSAGPRACIGAGFASMEAALILAAVAGRFRLEFAEGFRAERMATVTLRPKRGMRMRVVGR